jgi:hypothetical protein
MKVIKDDEVSEIVFEDPKLGTITWKLGPEIRERLNGFPYPGPEELSRVIGARYIQVGAGSAYSSSAAGGEAAAKRGEFEVKALGHRAEFFGQNLAGVVALGRGREAQDHFVEGASFGAVALDALNQLAQADIFLRLFGRKRDRAAQNKIEPAKAALLDIF